MEIHTILHYVEYFALPLIVVFITSALKFLATNRRKKFIHFFNLGLDLVIMASFGIIIHFISIYTHLPEEGSSSFFFWNTIAFTVSILFSITVAVIIKSLKEESKRCIIITNIIGIISVMVLLMFVENGKQLYQVKNKKGHETVSETKM